MDVTILDRTGLPVMCQTEGCRSKATSSWSLTVMAGGAPGVQRYSCGEHSPFRFTGVVPSGFTSQPVCHACGQPVPFRVA